MLNKIKGLVAASYMSLQKINDVQDTQKTTKDDNIVQEQQTRKQEINLLSQKRFYDILNRVDDMHRKKYEYHSKTILESRGINENFLSFKNQTYYPSAHEELMDTGVKTYKFRTNNRLNEFASDVHIKEQNGVLTLNFLINIVEYPEFKMIRDNLVNLNHFSISHYAKVYHYEIVKFLGFIAPNPYEIFVVFEANNIINGEYQKELDDTSQRTHKNNLIDPKTYIIKNQ